MIRDLYPKDPLKIGDKVKFIRYHRYSERVCEGVVVGFTKKRVIVHTINSPNTRRYTFPQYRLSKQM